MLTLTKQNISEILKSFEEDKVIVVCLCAAWCDVCNEYKQKFRLLESKFLNLQLVWIDIEDQCEISESFEVDNFPTILIQVHDSILFYGTMTPEISQILMFLNKNTSNIKEIINSKETGSHNIKQNKNNLRVLLKSQI
tara:strand:- start:274 stop:687 length:414 start_codon:yes stop_codon:yes gene_type:complete